jgi:hypothetical protein
VRRGHHQQSPPCIEDHIANILHSKDREWEGREKTTCANNTGRKFIDPRLIQIPIQSPQMCPDRNESDLVHEGIQPNIPSLTRIIC